MEKSECISGITELLQVELVEMESERLFAGKDDISRQFLLSFGSAYSSLFTRNLGDRVHIAAVRPSDDPGELAAIFPFAFDARTREAWSERAAACSPSWARRIHEDKGIVLMDFSSVSPHWRGHAVACFRTVASALANNGFSLGITEVQWLRQLILWQRNGWKTIHEPVIDLTEIYFTIRTALLSRNDPQSNLPEGMKFIWHQEAFYDRPAWNVVLEEPVYLFYPFSNV